MAHYTLDNIIYHRLLRFKGKIFCKKCGKDLHIGDCVKTKKSSNRGITAMYHNHCFDKMYIDLDD